MSIAGRYVPNLVHSSGVHYVPICLNRGFDGLNGGHGGRQGNLTQWRKDAEKKTGKWESESVGVGSHQPVGRGNPAPTIGIVFRSSGALCL